MFTIDINTEDFELRVTLNYTDGKNNFTFSPECNFAVKNFNLETDTSLDMLPSNGECNIHWNEDYISFKVVNAVGDGGSSYFSVPNTPEVLKSLKECIAIWKEKAEAL